MVRITPTVTFQEALQAILLILQFLSQTNPLTNPTKIQQACVQRSRMLSAATIMIPSTQLALMK